MRILSMHAPKQQLARSGLKRIQAPRAPALIERSILKYVKQPQSIRNLSTQALRSPLCAKPDARPRGQQWRGARWENYTRAGEPHGKPWRLSPEGIVYTVIALNGAVFLVWGAADSRMKSLNDPGMKTWMIKNFTSMWVNLKEGRVWTLVTPAFSHIEPMHFLLNMFMLYQFGTDIARVLGPKRFLLFYLGTAVGGNLLSTVMRGVVMPARTGDRSTMLQPALGASTSTVGITTLFACLYPNAMLSLFFVVPVPAWLASVGFIGWDLWRVMSAKRTRIDGAGHLGGAFAALGYYWFRLRPLIRRIR
ncbi:hypothetical protein EDC05_004696 [Coemansia umbellata]|nr:hypothetical protein EDC05_004696 [Coemansia umbellata]